MSDYVQRGYSKRYVLTFIVDPHSDSYKTRILEMVREKYRVLNTKVCYPKICVYICSFLLNNITTVFGRLL